MFFESFYLKSCLYILHFISGVERNFGFCRCYAFKSIKMFLIRNFIVGNKRFIDNDITNIVCTKPDKNGKCFKAICKLGLCYWNIFCISPRALVFCVLNNNVTMLKYIKNLGYPLEMIIYADNYHLVKKKCLQNFVRLIDFWK